MVGRLHDRLGTGGMIIAVMALVAALGGSAYAASALTGKQKKEVKKIAKEFAGKEGPQGLAGPAGSQGQKGDKGDAGVEGKAGTAGTDGKDGTNGTDGESVTIEELEVGDPECPKGGAEFSNGSGVAYACNGQDGDSGGEQVILKSGETMKGLWVVGNGTDTMFGGAILTLSFPFELKTAPTETILITTSATEEEKAKCPGSASSPEPAAAGVLCLYVEFEPSATTLINSNAQTAGAALFFPESTEAFGAWAVKAP